MTTEKEVIGPEQVLSSPPEGFLYLTIQSPEAQNFGNAILAEMNSKNSPVGTVFSFAINGIQYVGRVEPFAPNETKKEWHKGVRLYMADPNASTTKPKIADTIKNPKVVGTTTGVAAGFAVGGPFGAIVGGALGYVGSLIYKDVSGK